MSVVVVMVGAMTTSGILLAIGIGCALACVGLASVLFSRTRIRRGLERIGIDPDGAPGSYEHLSEKQLVAYGRWEDRGKVLAVLVALTGVAAFILITFVWTNFAWVVVAACSGWTAWMVNERRKRGHA